MLVAEQASFAEELQMPREEELPDRLELCGVAQLREGRMVPGIVFEGEADEPTAQEVEAEVLLELALAANGEEHAPELCSQDLLGRDRRATDRRIDGVELGIE